MSDADGRKKTALVCGAGGFIGSHLVRRLVKDGYWVRGADQKHTEFSPTAAHDFQRVDLRDAANCEAAVRTRDGKPFDEVYQLAADMGGMGFIHSAECEIMRNSCLVNLNMTHAAATAGVPRYLFSSSACVYRDMEPDEPELAEDEAYPALPRQRVRLGEALRRAHGDGLRAPPQDDRPPRPLPELLRARGHVAGGREKAPAAMCRKIAETPDGGTIEIWGDGTAMRAYTYVDDMVDGIVTPDEVRPRERRQHRPPRVRLGRRARRSSSPGSPARRSTCATWTDRSGVRARNFLAPRMASIGWESKVSLREGLSRTYPWIASQVEAVAASR